MIDTPNDLSFPTRSPTGDEGWKHTCTTTAFITSVWINPFVNHYKSEKARNIQLDVLFELMMAWRLKIISPFLRALYRVWHEPSGKVAGARAYRHERLTALTGKRLKWDWAGSRSCEETEKIGQIYSNYSKVCFRKHELEKKKNINY